MTILKTKQVTIVKILRRRSHRFNDMKIMLEKLQAIMTYVCNLYITIHGIGRNTSNT